MIGPADPELGEGMCVKVGNIFPVKKDPALLGFVVTGDTVQQAGFSGSIWTNNGYQLARVHRKVNLVEGSNSTES